MTIVNSQNDYMNGGIFTTIKIRFGKPIFIDKHMDRLHFQAKQLQIGSIKLTLSDIQKYIDDNQLGDGALKIIINKSSNKPIIKMQSRELPESLTQVKLITVPDSRNWLKIYKTTDRSINDQARKSAVAKSADDALFTSNGNIIESTICNIFSLNSNGEIITPNLDGSGLRGIMRQVIMENSTVHEEHISQDSQKPLILVNCLRMQYATHLNGHEVADGKPLMKKLQIIIEKAEKIYHY